MTFVLLWHEIFVAGYTTHTQEVLVVEAIQSNITIQKGVQITSSNFVYHKNLKTAQWQLYTT